MNDMLGDHHKVDARMVRDRLRDHVYSLYLSYAFHIKGAVVAVAGFSVYSIIIDTSANNQVERVLFWLASMGFSCATIATWSRSCILTNSHANGWDTVLPFWAGVFEVLMFLVLSPLPKELNIRWVDWYFVYGCFSILTAGLVWNRLRQAREKEFRADDSKLSRMVADYRTWLAADAIGAAAFGALAIIMYIAARLVPHFVEPYHRLIGVALIFTAGTIVYNSSNQYKRLTKL